MSLTDKLKQYLRLRKAEKTILNRIKCKKVVPKYKAVLKDIKKSYPKHIAIDLIELIEKNEKMEQPSALDRCIGPVSNKILSLLDDTCKALLPPTYEEPIKYEMFLELAPEFSRAEKPLLALRGHEGPWKPGHTEKIDRILKCPHARELISMAAAIIGNNDYSKQLEVLLEIAEKQETKIVKAIEKNDLDASQWQILRISKFYREFPDLEKIYYTLEMEAIDSAAMMIKEINEEYVAEFIKQVDQKDDVLDYCRTLRHLLDFSFGLNKEPKSVVYATALQVIKTPEAVESIKALHHHGITKEYDPETYEPIMRTIEQIRHINESAVQEFVECVNRIRGPHYKRDTIRYCSRLQKTIKDNIDDLARRAV